MDNAHPELVTVFGGSGFIGTRLVQSLAGLGYGVRVGVRRPDLAGRLRLLGTVGQIQLTQANIRDAASVAAAVSGASAVVNLTGILFETGRQRFTCVHTIGAKTVATATAAAGIKRLVHMSAIGASPDAESQYARSKGLGEIEVHTAFPAAVIMRPSIVFGPDDGFFNRFAALARLFPVLPLIGGDTRFQPVCVGDVAAALAAAVDGKARAGTIYELGGAQVETMREMMVRMLREIRRTNPLVPVPAPIAKFMAHFLQLLPHPLLSVDQVIELAHDNVVSAHANSERRTLAAFGITPAVMDAVLPGYLWRFRPHGQFEDAKAAS